MLTTGAKSTGVMRESGPPNLFTSCVTADSVLPDELGGDGTAAAGAAEGAAAWQEEGPTVEAGGAASGSSTDFLCRCIGETRRALPYAGSWKKGVGH